MRQLTGLDASFLYLETANAPMHITSLGIYDPATAPGGEVRFKQILDNVQSRVGRVPSMTERLVHVPMQLDHPYWKADGQFDPEFHIRHIALPEPGDWRQLCIQVARLHARPLDRGKPLWEMYIIGGLDNVEGLPKGCFAVMSKMHHAAVDGHTSVEIAAATHDLSPDFALSKTPQVVRVENDPSKLELLLRSQINTIKQPFRFVSVARNTIPGIGRLVSGLRSGKLERIVDIPRTRFNATVSPHRVFEAQVFDFEDFRIIKNVCQPATVNDVALTIVGGALRKYLSAKDELPQQSLVAMAPINVRTKDKMGTGGNEVSQMAVRVHSEIANPLERLQAVHQGTQSAKAMTNAIGAKTMTDYGQFIPSTLTASAVRLSSSMGLANRIKPSHNCVVTNVPGPQIPLYFTGAKLVRSYGMGPPIDGMGLFHAIGSYCGQMMISVTCCREMMPDPAFYAQCIRESFDELKSAAVASESAVRKQPTQKRRSARKTAKPKAGRKEKAL